MVLCHFPSSSPVQNNPSRSDTESRFSRVARGGRTRCPLGGEGVRVPRNALGASASRLPAHEPTGVGWLGFWCTHCLRTAESVPNEHWNVTVRFHSVLAHWLQPFRGWVRAAVAPVAKNLAGVHAGVPKFHSASAHHLCLQRLWFEYGALSCDPPPPPPCRPNPAPNVRSLMNEIKWFKPVTTIMWNYSEWVLQSTVQPNCKPM